MSIKIETKRLSEYLNVITIKGKIAEVMLNFTSDGIVSNNIMEGNIGATFSTLKKESFEDYVLEPINIGIKDSTLLIDVLNSFYGVVTLDISESVLKIYNESKSANIILMKPEFITTIFPKDSKVKLYSKFDNGIKTSSKLFKDSVSSSNVLKSETFQIECSNKKITINTGEDNFNKITETGNLDYKDFKSKYDVIMKDVIGIIPETITFTVIGDNAPCMFKINNDYYTCDITLAPLMDNN